MNEPDALFSPTPSAADTCEDRLRAGGMAAPAFQRAVLRTLAQVPGITAHAVAPFVISVDAAGARSTVRLDEAFKRYRHGENEPEWVAAEVAAAVGVSAEAVASATGLHVPSAGPFPRLARPSDVPATAASVPAPLDPALAVFFVREMPTGHIALSDADVAAGWADLDALFNEALRKLADRTPQGTEVDHGVAAERVRGFATGDGFDAARALLGDRLTELAAGVQGNALFAIPTRDVLMVIGDADPEFVAAAEAHVAEQYATHPFPVSDKWYRLSTGPGSWPGVQTSRSPRRPGIRTEERPNGDGA